MKLIGFLPVSHTNPFNFEPCQGITNKAYGERYSNLLGCDHTFMCFTRS